MLIEVLRSCLPRGSQPRDADSHLTRFSQFHFNFFLFSLHNHIISKIYVDLETNITSALDNYLDNYYLSIAKTIKAYDIKARTFLD